MNTLQFVRAVISESAHIFILITPAKGAHHMKAKRMVAAIAAVSIISLGLAACTASGPSKPAGKVALTVEDYFVPPADPVIDKIYASCAVSTDTKLTLNHVPGAGLIAKVLQQASSKTLPDVLMLDNPDVQQIAASGALSPVTNFGLSGKGASVGTVKASTYKGKLYGLQPIANSIALFYNKDMLSAAGITPPTTWAELAADATKLTTPKTYGFAFSGINTYEGTWQFMPFMWSNGGSEKDLNSPQNVQTLAFLTSLITDGSTSKSVVGWAQSDVDNQFIAGKAAMMINGPWQIPSLQAAKGLNWAYVQIPTRTSSQVSQSPLGGEDYTIPNTGDKTKQAAAAKFIACITSAKNETENAAANEEVPTNVAADAAFAQANPNLAGFLQIIKNGRARTALLGAGWPAAATTIYQAEQLGLTGKASPADAWTQAASQ
jgi:multiple sugar transport system substrate-binding protein